MEIKDIFEAFISLKLKLNLKIFKCEGATGLFNPLFCYSTYMNEILKVGIQLKKINLKYSENLGSSPV